MNPHPVTLPLESETLRKLRSGDMLHLNGILYTARDAAHKRLLGEIKDGKALPIPLKDQVIYYVGPAPAKPGQVIGPAGPTTSGRMDPYTLPLLQMGVKGFIGKGYRSPDIVQALAQYEAIYMVAIGGAAALIAKHITSSRIVAYPDLGTEAIHELHVQDFPVIVVNDSQGRDAYQQGRMNYAKSL